jgi:hypothetical protein
VFHSFDQEGVKVTAIAICFSRAIGQRNSICARLDVTRGVGYLRGFAAALAKCDLSRDAVARS